MKVTIGKSNSEKGMINIQGRGGGNDYSLTYFGLGMAIPAARFPPRKSGFTMVELIVGVAIACTVLTVVFKMYGSVLFGFRHGFVNLQNFQDAHIAISYLRRDFSTSCPFLTEGDGSQELRNTLRRPVDLIGEKNLGQNEKIFITDNRVCFYRYLNEPFSPTSKPTVERVEYFFDPEQKALIRRGRNGKVFKGFREVLFKCYVHEVNSQIPVLWVKFVIDRGEGEGGGNRGKPLELTTSITSAYIADISNCKNWNHRSFHVLKN